LKPFASIVDKSGEKIVLHWGKSTYTGVLFDRHFYAAYDALHQNPDTARAALDTDPTTRAEKST
jgi:hypothetical protein